MTIQALPLDRLHHPGVVVHDARATARNYAEIMGINQWNVVHCGPDHLSNETTYGLRARHSYTCAYGRHEPSGLTFQLIQPHVGDSSTYSEFIGTRGPGIHNLCTSVVSRETFTQVQAWFSSFGIEVGQSATIDDAVDWYLFDTRRALGGFQIMVIVPRVDRWADALKVDEVWDFSDEVSRPDGVGPVPVARVLNLHFGVVVHDVVERMRRYARIFGLGEIPFFDIGTADAAPRSKRPTVALGNATYHGKPVAHRMFNSLTSVSDFGFEVIQTTVPPIHYKEDFLDVVGEGIHHFYPTELHSDREWNELNAWMGSIGIPEVQSGDMNCGQASGLGTYHYWDTRERLGGYVLEVVVARPGFWESFADAQPLMTLDFSAQYTPPGREATPSSAKGEL